MDINTIKSLGDLLSNAFSPNEAGAEVIPEDIKTRELIKKLLSNNDQGSQTYKIAHAIPQKTTVSATQPKWDEYIRDNIAWDFPKETNSAKKKELFSNFNSNVGGGYSHLTSHIAINPTQKKGFPQEKILGHELGHFLNAKLGGINDFKNKDFTEEEFVDWLGGYKLNDPKKKAEFQKILDSFIKRQPPTIP